MACRSIANLTLARIDANKVRLWALLPRHILAKVPHLDGNGQRQQEEESPLSEKVLLIIYME